MRGVTLEAGNGRKLLATATAETAEIRKDDPGKRLAGRSKEEA
jgi:hypothetical protein